MNFTLYYSSPKELAQKWVALFSGTWKLGDRGKELVVEVVTRHLELKDKVLDVDTLWEVLWSVKERKGYRERLKMSSAQFTNLLTDLRKANILVQHPGYEALAPQLLPEKEFKVTFHQQ